MIELCTYLFSTYSVVLKDCKLTEFEEAAKKFKDYIDGEHYDNEQELNQIIFWELNYGNDMNNVYILLDHLNQISEKIGHSLEIAFVTNSKTFDHQEVLKYIRENNLKLVLS